MTTTRRGRQHPDGPLEPPPDWPDAAGHFLANLLAPVTQPGPPYTHTLVPPEPIGELEDGTLVYPEPGPVLTLTEGRLDHWLQRVRIPDHPDASRRRIRQHPAPGTALHAQHHARPR
jgi:hypothetical protein